MADYISIKEFASRAGVSTQAIYQRLDKDLKIFLQVENGKKRLSDEALKLFYDKNLKQDDCTTKQQTLQEEITLELIKTLQSQLVEKDKQLEQAAAEKAALLERLKDAQHSEQQAHVLHAGTMQATQQIESRSAEAQENRRGWKFWKR